MWRRKGRGDAGAGTLEYAGGIAIAAVLVGAVLAAGGVDVVPAKVSAGVCSIFGGDCADGGSGTQAQPAAQTGPGAPSGGDVPGGEDHDRRDTQREARGDRRGRGDDEDPPGPGTPGVQQPASPLGAPSTGTKVPEPDPPEWEPVDAGAGEHGSESPGVKDRATDFAAETAANAMAGTWPDASRNLLHFLGNSGDPLRQDVDKILKDVPEFARTVEEQRLDLASSAVADARRRGATEPITYPVNTAWTGYGYDPPYENKNWFYALGGWQFNQTGQVTVYPPAKPGDAWRYEVTTHVNLRDQYNWDGGKATDIGPFTVTDEQLAELHRKGLAREFAAYGRSGQGSVEGTVP